MIINNLKSPQVLIQGLILVGDFRYPETCSKINTMMCKQFKRFLDCVKSNLPKLSQGEHLHTRESIVRTLEYGNWWDFSCWKYSRCGLTGPWIWSKVLLWSEGWTRWSPGVLSNLGYPVIEVMMLYFSFMLN